MNLYLVKVINDKIVEYEFISNNLSINELNNNPKLSYYPRLGKNDKNLIILNGRTLLFKLKENNYHYLINLEFIDLFGGKINTELLSWIKTIKRDMQLNSIYEV